MANSPNLQPDLSIFKPQQQSLSLADLISFARMARQANYQPAATQPNMPGGSGAGSSQPGSQTAGSGAPGWAAPPGFQPTAETAGPGAPGWAGQSPTDVHTAMYSGWANEGMSSNGIAGVFANVKDESGFNPSALTKNDQPNPKFAGTEARHAHGLYQEGGDEWNNYSKWLKDNHPDADWRDPGLQSQFAAWNLKNNYPSTWKKMNNAQSPGEAAATYVREYLKPAQKFQDARANKYLRGTPSLDDWLKRKGVSQGQLPGMAQGGVIDRPATVVDQKTGQPIATIAEQGPEAVVPQGLYNAAPNAGQQQWTQVAENAPSIRGTVEQYERRIQEESVPKAGAPSIGDTVRQYYQKKEPSPPDEKPTGTAAWSGPPDPLDKFNRYANRFQEWRKEDPANELLALTLGGTAAKVAGEGLGLGVAARSARQGMGWLGKEFARQHPAIAKGVTGGASLIGKATGVEALLNPEWTINQVKYLLGLGGH